MIVLSQANSSNIEKGIHCHALNFDSLNGGVHIGRLHIAFLLFVLAITISSHVLAPVEVKTPSTGLSMITLSAAAATKVI